MSMCGYTKEMKQRFMFMYISIVCYTDVCVCCVFCVSDCTVALTWHGSGTRGDCADVYEESGVGGGPV